VPNSYKYYSAVDQKIFCHRLQFYLPISCGYYQYYFKPFDGFASVTGETMMDDVFTRYPELALVLTNGSRSLISLAFDLIHINYYLTNCVKFIQHSTLLFNYIGTGTLNVNLIFLQCKLSKKIAKLLYQKIGKNFF